MVPNASLTLLALKSTLTALNNLLTDLLKISNELQKSIQHQNWQMVYSLSDQKKQINHQFDLLIKKIEFSNNPETRNDVQICMMKRAIKDKITSYREIESINMKMLNDARYIAKQKIEKFFQNGMNTETYSRELKKEFWNDSPVLLNRLI